MSELEIPRIVVKHRGRGKDDPTPYQADAWFPSGRDYHAVAATPAEALFELAVFWRERDEERHG